MTNEQLAQSGVDTSKIVRIAQLNTFKNNLAPVAISGDASDVDLSTVTGLQATNVQSAIEELLTKVGGSDITVDQTTTQEGMLSTTQIKKNGVTIGTINIPKDYVNNIIGIVSKDGNNNDGTFLKVNTAAVGDTAVYEYVDVSGLVEYITVGTQTGNAVQLTINNDHKITGNIANGSVTKTMLDSSVQDSLNLADSALQSHQNISGKADKVTSATANNFAGLDSNGNLKDSGYNASSFQAAGNYKTTQSAVSDPTANGTGITFIASASQNANGVITVTKKTVQNASSSQAGLMTAAHYSKLDAIEYATDSDITAMFA